MTLTIELPEELAAQLATLAPEERNRFAVAALADKLAAQAGEDDPLVTVFDDTGRILPEAGAVGRAPRNPLPPLPPPGFARASRLAREAAGDARSAAAILRDNWHRSSMSAAPAEELAE